MSEEKGSVLFNYQTASPEELRRVNDLFRKQEHRAVTIPSRIKYGSTPIYEIAGLVHAFEMVPPFPPECLIVEIGSLVGKSTVALASLRRHKVVSIDPHDGPWEKDYYIGDRDRRVEWGNTLEEFQNNLRYYGVDDNVDIIQKRSDDAAAEWDYEHRICLHFIDGCHEYEQVKKDYTLWVDKMIGGCVIAFHDYNPHSFPEVVEAVDEIEATGRVTLLFQLGSLKMFTLK